MSLAGKPVDITKDWTSRNQSPTTPLADPSSRAKQLKRGEDDYALRGSGKHQEHVPVSTEHPYRYPYTRQDTFPNDGKPSARAVDIHDRPTRPADKTFRPKRLRDSALGDGAAVVGSPYRTLETSNVED